MVRYFAKRLGMMLVALFLIMLLTFSIMHAVPGGPFTSDRNMSEEVEAALNAKYHLDRPLPEQFFEYVTGILRGDLGPSYKYPGKDVNDFVENGFPVSARLGFITIVFVLLAAIPMGILAAVKNGKWQDMVLMAVATIGVTIPSFVIASVLIYVFSFKLNVLPTYGLDTWKGYILPVVALGGYSISYMARLMRSSLLEVMGQDYIRTARAKGLSAQDQEDLLSGAACIVKNPIPFAYEGASVETTNLRYDDVISVNGHKLRVAGITDTAVTINNEGYTNGIQITVTDSMYNLLTGNDRYAELYPTLSPNAEHETFEAMLEQWCQANPGSHWISYQQTTAQLEESFAQINMLCWGLILFIGLIGILNIINTVYSNIHTRISEIGMQRAIGMSAGSLYKTFLWEGAYYGIIASAAGGVLGYICTVFVNAAVTDSLQFAEVPFVSILEAAAASIAACLLATAVPLRSIARMNIVESIETVD